MWGFTIPYDKGILFEGLYEGSPDFRQPPRVECRHLAEKFPGWHGTVVIVYSYLANQLNLKLLLVSSFGRNKEGCFVILCSLEK